MSAPPVGLGVPPPPPPIPGQHSFLPPLPPPWTEHRAPAGQPYWFNPQTNVSTYTRPLPPPPPPGFGPGGPLPPQQFAPPLRFGSNAPTPVPEKKEKKEKPKEKLPIEGTEWIKVTTNKGNVFYTHKGTKESVWTVPEEVKLMLEEAEKASKKRKAEKEAQVDQEKGALEVEVEGAEGAQPLATDTPAAAPTEDKEIVVEPKKKKAKKNKVVREIEELEQDEEWQKQVAEEMAKEVADAEAREQQQEAAPMSTELPQRPTEPDAVTRAPRIDVSDEEGAAMFKTMLSEKDISPMAPWDMELPKFINDPRYLAVKQLKSRRDLFDEFCKEKIREIRAAKKKAQEAGGAVKADPLAAYRALLLATVTSTRTHFSDFKRANAKDSRFREFGKTEGEKEKVFKSWLRELGEKKRQEAERAEREFGEMLSGDEEIKQGDLWAQVKTRHASDPRYSAVNSSSLRESLFKKHLASLASGGKSEAPTSAPAASAPTKEDRAARAAASLREREEQVRAEKERVARSAQAARGAMGREEGEREWGTLLVDLVRDHEARFEDVLPVLSRDSRFTSSPLSPNDQRRLFEAHLRNLYTKRLSLVENLFLSNSSSLTTPFTTILPSITDNPHVKSLVGSDYDRLESLFDAWSRRRVEAARAEFEQLMRESPILEHWGRLQKREEVDGKIRELGIQQEGAELGEAGGEDEGDEGDEVPTLTEMAKQVDLKAIHAVLKHDKRYLVFDHDPERRNQWIEDYLRNLVAPKSTVHQKE